MEQYLRKNRFGAWLDGAAKRVMVMVAAVGWFVYLWGLGMPAILAGSALGLMMLMALSRGRGKRILRRENALRRRLGAELMMEDMLLSPAREAHFRAALLLGEKYPIELLRVTDDGMLCRSGEDTVLIICLRMPAEGEISAGDLAACQRGCRAQGAARGVVCPLGRVSAKILAKAEMGPVPLRVIRREELMTLAGVCSPATDAQLAALGQRRRRVAGTPAVRIILQKEKAGRYMLCGLALLVLYILTDVRLYPLPGLLCLGLGVGSACRRENAGPL